MATTRIISLHGHKGQTIDQTLHDRIDYAKNPDKTQGGRLVSSYECLPNTAADEFAMSKYLYGALTGKERPPSQDVLAYMIRQSFKPDEVTPEQANEIGYALAMEFTKGEHQFIVATHTDKQHIHSHIIFNSTTLDCERKFANPHQCGRDVARISDRLCREHGLSVVENPKQKGKSYKEWDERRKGQSWKGKLQEAIDRVLPDSRDFGDFLARMRSEGYEVKLGKNISFRAPGQERFTRSKTLGPEYTPEALRERLSGPRGRSAAGKTAPQNHSSKVNLLIDIQAKLQAGKGVGYEKWAKVFNLKEAAKTLNFLTDNGLTDYDELAARAEEAGQKFDAASARIKQIEARLSELSELRTHITSYSKTRAVYAAFRKTKDKKEYRLAHESELAMHEAAKKAFDKLGGTKIPTVAQIQKEFSGLLAEKKELYETYMAARKEMLEYQTAKQNIDRLLSIQPPQETRRETER